jgi:ectoine hydroxylase
VAAYGTFGARTCVSAVVTDRRTAFERDGYVVLTDVLSGVELRRLSDAVGRVWNANGPQNGAVLHELAFLGLDRSFLELVDHPAVLPLVLDLLGWNIYVYHCHLDVHPPQPPPPSLQWRWHQDGGRQNVDLESPRPRLSVKAGYFLTDVRSPDDGAMCVIPGSHVRDVLERPTDPLERPPGAIPLLVDAGSVVVFDRRLWHARGDNVGRRTRRVLFYAYTYRWIRLRDDPRLDVMLLADLSPVQRQLLGAGTDSTGWFPGDDDVPLRATALGML